MSDIVEIYGLKWNLSAYLAEEYFIRENSYRALFTPEQQPRSLKPTDVWLDIGANIGAFAVRAATHVAEVIAIEPAPDNIAVLRENIEINGVDNVHVIEAAVLGAEKKQVSLALSNTCGARHRVGTVRGRSNIWVEGLPINDLVEYYKANKLKIDCEGGELEILREVDLAPIEEIICEWHLLMIGDREWLLFYAMLDRLKEAGFEILKQPKSKNKSWHTVFWAKRPETLN